MVHQRRHLPCADRRRRMTIATLPGGFAKSVGSIFVQVNYYAYGAITPVLSYALSVLGSLLGLVCTARARAIADGRRRARWLLLAAWAIGGTGIWVMHFMAMLGYTVTGEQIRYDPALTVASLLIAIAIV